MKNLYKRFWPFSFTLLALILLCASCKKEDIQEQKTTGLMHEDTSQVIIDVGKYPISDIIITNGIMSFKSRQHYDDVIMYLAQLGDNNFNAFEDTLNFNSLRKSVSASEKLNWKFGDDLLFSMLNPDGLIAINDKIFYLNFENETATVFDKKDMLSKNYTGETFSFDSNVLDLYYPYPDDTEMKASCVGIANKDVKSNVWGQNLPPGSNYVRCQYELKDNYQSAAIYFSLLCKINQIYGNGWQQLWAGANGSYQKRGSSSTYMISGSSGGSTHEASYRPYEGSRCLTAYQCTGSYTEQVWDGSKYTYRTWTLYNGQ